MRKRSLFVVSALLILQLTSLRADQPWEPLWRFETHG